MSPTLKIEVRNVTYNESKKELFVEVVQVFHVRWNPLPAAPARSVPLKTREHVSSLTLCCA